MATKKKNENSQIDRFLNLILDTIPSADTSQYLWEMNWKPTEKDMATILSNLEFSYMKEIEYLRDFASCVNSEELKKMVENEAREREIRMQEFCKLDPGFVYVLQWLNPDGSKDLCGVFDAYHIVRDFAASDIKEFNKHAVAINDPMVEKLKGFQIEKNRIIGPGDDPEEEMIPYAVQQFDEAGILLHCYDNARENRERPSQRISNRYVHIPHPFRDGDRVRIIGTDLVGTISYDPEDMKKLEDRYRAGAIELDWFDVCVTVEYDSDENDYMNHDHINPMYIEYA